MLGWSEIVTPLGTARYRYQSINCKGGSSRPALSFVDICHYIGYIAIKNSAQLIDSVCRNILPSLYGIVIGLGKTRTMKSPVTSATIICGDSRTGRNSQKICKEFAISYFELCFISSIIVLIKSSSHLAQNISSLFPAHSCNVKNLYISIPKLEWCSTLL